MTIILFFSYNKIGDKMEYVGIFQGGGMKGLAYMGAICALEECGIKAKKVAGTSIGAASSKGYLSGSYQPKVLPLFPVSSLTIFHSPLKV